MLPHSSELAVNSLHAIMVTVFVVMILVVLRYYAPFGERYQSQLDVLHLTAPFVDHRERDPSCKSAGGRQSRDYLLAGSRPVPLVKTIRESM